MGVGASYACLDCKKIYYVGYGSYGSWIFAETVEAFDARARIVSSDRDLDEPWTADGNLHKNQNIRRVLVEHAGHRITHWNHDYEWGRENNTIYAMGSYGVRGDVILADVDSYESIDLYT